MTDLPLVSLRSQASAPRRPLSRVTTLYLAAAAAAAGGLAVALVPAAVGGLEWQLVLLLRFMAVVKATMVLGALALTHWRFRQPIGEGLAAGFVAAIAAMLVAPGLIWSLRHVAGGAALFHAGLLAFLVLAWKDDAADRLLASRRARRSQA